MVAKMWNNDSKNGIFFQLSNFANMTYHGSIKKKFHNHRSMSFIQVFANGYMQMINVYLIQKIHNCQNPTHLTLNHWNKVDFRRCLSFCQWKKCAHLKLSHKILIRLDEFCYRYLNKRHSKEYILSIKKKFNIS